MKPDGDEKQSTSRSVAENTGNQERVTPVTDAQRTSRSVAEESTSTGGLGVTPVSETQSIARSAAQESTGTERLAVTPVSETQSITRSAAQESTGTERLGVTPVSETQSTSRSAAQEPTGTERLGATPVSEVQSTSRSAAQEPTGTERLGMKANADEDQSTSRGVAPGNTGSPNRVVRISDDPGITPADNRTRQVTPVADGQSTSQGVASEPTSTERVGVRIHQVAEVTSINDSPRQGGIDGGADGMQSRSPSLHTLEREVKQYIYKRESSAYRFYPGTETMDYDFVEERNDLYSTNLIESTAHLIKGSLGAGVLSMHEAYMYGGLWTSLIVTIFIGVSVTFCILMLSTSAQKMYVRLRRSKLSYPDLAEVAAATAPWLCLRRRSKVFRYTVDLCIFLALCGTCCIYQIIVAHTLKQVLEGINANFSTWLTDIRLYIVISTPLLLLLCMIRSLKFLAPFSLIADIFIAICVMTTLYYSLRTVGNISDRPAWKSHYGLGKFFGICLYCTCGIAVAMPVENNMAKPRSFNVVVYYAMTIVTLCTTLTGFFGYWGWGEACRSPITRHMPTNTFTIVLQFLLVMMLCVTFAVQFWVPFRIVWHYISRKHKSKIPIWERFYRLLLATLVTVVSVTFPDMIPVMIFLGHSFLGLISFVFPAFIEMMIFWPDRYQNIPNRWKIFKDVCFIAMGFLLSASSFYAVKG